MDMDAQEAAARAQLGAKRFAEFADRCASILRDHTAACEKVLDRARRDPRSIRRHMDEIDRLDRDQVRRFKAVWTEYGLDPPDPLPPGW